MQLILEVRELKAGGLKSFQHELQLIKYASVIQKEKKPPKLESDVPKTLP